MVYLVAGKEIADIPPVDVSFFTYFCKPRGGGSGSGAIPFRSLEDRRAAFAALTRRQNVGN
jgi:hypothetical protein